VSNIDRTALNALSKLICYKRTAFRVLDLPTEVDPDKVHATFNNGELEVTLIKKHNGKKHLAEGQAA
jgi:HSP20 family molecular chaperone IbpA